MIERIEAGAANGKTRQLDNSRYRLIPSSRFGSRGETIHHLFSRWPTPQSPPSRTTRESMTLRQFCGTYGRRSNGAMAGISNHAITTVFGRIVRGSVFTVRPQLEAPFVSLSMRSKPLRSGKGPTRHTLAWRLINSYM